MCLESIGTCWNNVKECFVSKMSAFFTWIMQAFSGGPESDSTSFGSQGIDSQASESTQLVDPLKEGTSGDNSSSHSQTSEETVVATSKSLANICIAGQSVTLEELYPEKSKEKKLKGSLRSSKRASKVPDEVEVAFSQRSKSDPSISINSKSKKQKKKPEHVDIQIEDEIGSSFIVVKDKKSRKKEKVTSSVSDNKQVTADQSVGVGKETRTQDKHSAFTDYRKKPKSTSNFKGLTSETSSTSFAKNLEEKESKKVDSSLTYAQITSYSSQSQNDNNFVEIEGAHREVQRSDVEFKKPDPPRPIRKFESQCFDSSEDSSGSPVFLVEQSLIHREDFTSSENSEVNAAESKITAEGKTEEEDIKAIEDTFEIIENVHGGERKIKEDKLIGREEQPIEIKVEKSENNEKSIKKECSLEEKEEESSGQQEQVCKRNKEEPIKEKEQNKELGEEKLLPHNKKELATEGQKSEEPIEEPIAHNKEVKPLFKLAEKHPNQIEKEVVDLFHVKNISLKSKEETRVAPPKDRVEEPNSLETTNKSEFQLSWNSEEFHNRLYENDPSKRVRIAFQHDSQNTTHDVPSDILDSDSLKVEETDKLSLGREELSGTESLQEEKPEESFPESRAADEFSVSNRTEDLIGEDSLAEVLQSSEFGEIDYSATKEENRELLDTDESSEKLVSEEIQEEEKVIQGVPEVEYEASGVLFNHKDQISGKRDHFEDYGTLTEKFIRAERQEIKERSINNSSNLIEDFISREINSEKSLEVKTITMPVRTSENPRSPPKGKIEEIQSDVQVRVLTLNDQGFQESTLYRLEKNWVIVFRLGPTLFGRKISIYCNYPGSENGRLKDFVRDNYRLLSWKKDEGCENSDDTSLYTQITCELAGSFHYYYTQEESVSEKKICGSGYFLVDPVITNGDDEKLPLDCIQCQTVIAKHLGPFSTWEDKLKVSKESGYNMIHFSPVQELGDSNSAYCLKDQMQLNPVFKKPNNEMPTWEDLKLFIDGIKRDWKMTSICDIVLNHTANESTWLVDHPDATYNCRDCTYMRPAYLLDAAFHQFSMEVKDGMYETRGIPPIIDSEDHLNAIRYHLSEGVLKELKIHELYICDTNQYVSRFMDLARQSNPGKEPKLNAELKLIQDPEFRRLTTSVDMDLAMQIYNIYRPGCFDEDSRLRKCCEEFKRKLDALNNEVIEEIQHHLNVAVANVLSAVSYWRVEADGPRVGAITPEHPLITRYFTDYGAPKNMKEYEAIMYSDTGRFLMAHNGWVMNGDPLVNFAGPQSNVYLRRELIAWGDSVKLRFGEKPSDCPFLWDHMRKYVEQTVRIFDGVRLDNCHSTPIQVAEYLLDHARKIRPDLYVVAELFTNSDEKDNIFVNKLGISSLIREALNAWDSHEQGRLVHRFGGVPVGSFYQPNTRPLVPSIAHALFMDLTHDNPSPMEKRSVFDLLPSAALVSMACCGTGSSRGYDELVPHHISVVEETREYTEWSFQSIEDNPKYVSSESGIISAKRALNDLHYKLGNEGFNQVYVDQMDPDVVAVTRHCPFTHQSYIMVAFTAFKHPGENDHKWQRSIRPLRVEGVLDEIILEATLSHEGSSNGGSKYAHPQSFEKNSRYINGHSEYRVHIKKNIQLAESDIFEEINSGNPNEIALNFKNFKPGSVVVIKVSLPKTTAENIRDVRKRMSQLSLTKDTELSKIIKKMTMSSLNRTLYRCDQEERDEGRGFDTYGLPGFEKLVYSGLQGFLSILSKIRPNNDLGHPMCDNLRQGNWMIDYIFQRLKLDEGTEELGRWIEENTKSLKAIPRYLKPAYFDAMFTGIYILLVEHAHKSMSSFVNRGSIFVKGLSMGSLQFAGYVKSADLPVLSPNLAPPKPPVRLDENGKEIQACVTLSAGLPRFSVGYMRNWGRDTFIALRGLLILTGRYQEARYHILGYGACLRHGLIPNLLDGGRNPRFNCRDAVWWWLYCIKSYVEEVPQGSKILDDKVSRIFPTDESPPQQPGETDQSLQDVVQEALTRHFQGARFRERNAGRGIDEQMKDNGFNNQIGVHPDTGFVFGGNVDNCGTWMDKMGSSYKAGNKGQPATPRDGSACEIVGLSKSVISWLATLYDQKIYKYDGVERKHLNGNVTKWTFKTWSEKIQENFERYFWVNAEPTEGEIRPDLINKRGIYKDCYGATQDWTDFQLRCNFPIVMVVAPELFQPERAWMALQQAEKHLLGPLGMKTLDPSDWAYRGDYDNSNDSNDPSVAQGFNYHQGPEWVWPVGYFFRAKLHFASKVNKLEETIAETKYKLSKHFTELQTSDWRGLPELTNSNGSYCKDSSRTQAWSMSSILEVLYDLEKIESSDVSLTQRK